MRYEILKTEGMHETGTKFYNIYAIFDKVSNLAVVVQHWGKASLNGKMKITTYNDTLWGRNYSKDKKLEKMDRGYLFGESKQILDSDYPSSFTDELIKILGNGAQYDDVIDHFGFSPLAEIRGQKADTIIMDEIGSSKPLEKPVNPDPVWGSW